MSNSNSMQITAVDNELYILAVCSDENHCYQLAHIQSGFDYKVEVDVTITPGEYKEPATLNGTNGPLVDGYIVSIPSGTYSLLAVGIDWGGASQIAFSVTSNGTTNQYGSPYSNGPNPINIFWTNNGTVLQEITV